MSRRKGCDFEFYRHEAISYLRCKDVILNSDNSVEVITSYNFRKKFKNKRQFISYVCEERYFKDKQMEDLLNVRK